MGSKERGGKANTQTTNETNLENVGVAQVHHNGALTFHLEWFCVRREKDEEGRGNERRKKMDTLRIRCLVFREDFNRAFLFCFLFCFGRRLSHSKETKRMRRKRKRKKRKSNLDRDKAVVFDILCFVDLVGEKTVSSK